MKTLWQTWCYIQLTLISRGLFSVVHDWLVDNEDSPAVLWNRWAKNWRMTSPDTAKWHRKLPWCWFTPGVDFFNKIAAKSQCLDLQWQEPNPEPQKPKWARVSFLKLQECQESCVMTSLRYRKKTTPPKDSWRLANAFQAGQDSENLFHSAFDFHEFCFSKYIHKEGPTVSCLHLHHRRWQIPPKTSHKPT